MIFDLIKGDDPILKQKCSEFDFDRGAFVETGVVLGAKELYELLRDKMIEHRGVGLSACQLGIMTRAFVIGNFNDPSSILGVFNPIITNYDEQSVVYEEGCLSYPGIFVKIKRSRGIRVRYTGWNGVTDSTRYEGYTARIFQHEYDHLNGVTFQSRANRYHLEKAKKFKNKTDRKLHT
jgi:peptide deformylase